MSDLEDDENMSILDLFHSEYAEQVKTLTEKFQLICSESPKKEHFDTCIRMCHSIKGAARIVQYQPLFVLTEAMEGAIRCAAANKKISIKFQNVFKKAIEQLINLVEIQKNKFEFYLEMNQENFERLANDVKNAAIEHVEPIVIEKQKEASKELELDLNMMELFLVELETQTAVMNQALVELERNHDHLQVVESLMRGAHSIKGAAKVVNINPIVLLAHAMEDCFVAIQKQELELTGEGIDHLFKAIDFFETMGKTPVKGIQVWLNQEKKTISQLTEQIQQYSRGIFREKSTEVHLPPPDRKIVFQREKEGNKQDRVLRVTAKSLNRLMGLAGESLVESKWLQPFSDSLFKMKKTQDELSEEFEALSELITDCKMDEHAHVCIDSIRGQLNEQRHIINDRLTELELFIRRYSSLSDRLYREVIDSRMRPFADGVESFPRMVRDIAQELGKKVIFEIEGKGTQVDREILEKLEAPLSHLLRNAIDHGIETTQERIKAGKPPEGFVGIQAYHQAGMLAITVTDNGRGIDLDALKAKIVEKQLVSKKMADNLSETELIDFLFLPGFSTKKNVTHLSGRGVGLNIVQSAIQEIGGNIRVQSLLGKGTVFHLNLPLTLSVIRALIVEVRGEPYAFPLTRIDRALIIPQEQIEMIENRQYFSFEEQNIGIISLEEILGMASGGRTYSNYSIIVISDRNNYYGVVVDRFLGERELVVQELDRRLGKVPDITAGGLMEDGDPVLIIDVEDLVRSIDSHLSGGKLHPILSGAIPIQEKKQSKKILIVDDSITVREVECRLLENKGYEVDVAVNGAEAWNAVRLGNYDLVITDVDMPRMSGIELTRLIKGDERFHNLPVMIVSYKEREADRLLGIDAGADYYLTKSSFHDQTLIQAVIEMIGEPNRAVVS